MNSKFEIESLTDEMKKLQGVTTILAFKLKPSVCPNAAARAVGGVAHRLGVQVSTELYKAIGRRGGEDVIEYFMVVTKRESECNA